MAFLEGALTTAALIKIWNSLPVETQRKIKQLIPVHHGEEGFWIALAGLIAKNPTLIGSGTTMIVDDWPDKDQWIQDVKNRVNLAISNIRNSIANLQYQTNYRTGF